MFHCPACRVPLRTFARQGVRVYGCPSCGGSAVTFETLRRLSPPPRFLAFWNAARDAMLGVRPCPSCARPMAHVPVKDGVDLVLDACRGCRLAWMDPTELPRLASETGDPRAVPAPRPDRPAAPPERDLPMDARRVIATVQAERIREQAEQDASDPGPTSAWQFLGALAGLPYLTGLPMQRERPWATWALTLVLGLAAVVAWTHGWAEVVAGWGLVPDEPLRAAGLTWITAALLHGGWMHLAGNAYFLLLFGGPLEDLLGWRRLLLLLGAATLAGELLHVAWDPRGSLPLVGASGGISGVIAYLCLRMPRAKAGFLLMGAWLARDGGRGPWIRLPVWAWFAFWAGVQVLGAAAQRRGCSTVSAAAHLGGVAAGVALWGWWERRRPAGTAPGTSAEAAP